MNLSATQYAEFTQIVAETIKQRKLDAANDDHTSTPDQARASAMAVLDLWYKATKTQAATAIWESDSDYLNSLADSIGE